MAEVLDTPFIGPDNLPNDGLPEYLEFLDNDVMIPTPLDAPNELTERPPFHLPSEILTVELPRASDDDLRRTYWAVT